MQGVGICCSWGVCVRVFVCCYVCVCGASMSVFCMSVYLSVRFSFLKSAYFSINFGFGLFQ